MLRRQARESLERRRDLQIAAFWANSSYDHPDINRAEISKAIEDSFADAINAIYGIASEREEEERLPDNDFFNAMRRGIAKAEADFGVPPPSPLEADPALSGRAAMLAQMLVPEVDDG